MGKQKPVLIYGLGVIRHAHKHLQDAQRTGVFLQELERVVLELNVMKMLIVLLAILAVGSILDTIVTAPMTRVNLSHMEPAVLEMAVFTERKHLVNH